MLGYSSDFAKWAAPGLQPYFGEILAGLERHPIVRGPEVNIFSIGGPQLDAQPLLVA